jgi:hypothetical protein
VSEVSSARDGAGKEEFIKMVPETEHMAGSEYDGVTLESSTLTFRGEYQLNDAKLLPKVSVMNITSYNQLQCYLSLSSLWSLSHLAFSGHYGVQ